MSKILIVGGTGLIGASLVERLYRDHIVYVLSRTKPIQEVEWIPADLETYNGWNTIEGDFTHLIYLAQSPYFREFPEKAQNVFQVNTVQFLSALAWAYEKKVPQIIYASTGGLYGQGKIPFKETSALSEGDELGFYFTTKRCAEIIASAYGALLNITLLRFFFVYGPEQKESMLIPRLLHQVKNKMPIFLQGEEGILLNPLYVEDAVDALEHCLSIQETALFNLAGPEVLSLKKIAETIGKVLGIEPCFEFKDSLKASCVSGDWERFSQHTNWRPKTSFLEGAQKMIVSIL